MADDKPHDPGKDAPKTAGKGGDGKSPKDKPTDGGGASST
jgi:hypothetical protein